MLDHWHPDHSHSSAKQRLWLSLLITLLFAAVEALAGWLVSSLALLSDAGHMVSDAAALGLAATTARLAQRPPSERHSYGFGRIEVVAALANGLFMLMIVAGILSTAVQRLQAPQDVNGEMVFIVATLGLIINLVVALILSRGEQNLNTRGALLHVLGDLLGSVAALLSGLVIILSGWSAIDPILSMVICVLILLSSLGLLRDALHVVMEGVPYHLSLSEVGLTMSSQEGVKSVHDLHIWTLSSGHIALSAHVVIEDINHWEALLHKLHELLRNRFGIEHTTLQPETFTRTVQRIPLASLGHCGNSYSLKPPAEGSSSK
jgi:cobalt-zinc-cadmium efflux system protein